MKKIIITSLLLVGILLFGGIAEANQEIPVYINGQVKSFNPAPQIMSGNTLVPMRAFFEALGAEVKWEGSTRTVTGIRGDTEVVLQIDNKTAYVNDVGRSLSVPAQLLNDSTFIPLRIVGEALGDKVVWNGETGSIHITSNTTGSDDPVEQEAGSQKPYTFMVYFNGTDLESGGGFATMDLAEMAQVGSNENLNFIIETGGTSKWQNEYIAGGQSQRWLVKNNALEKLLDLGNKNIGNPDTLQDFITWTVRNYPAEKYVLSFWNHGGGSVSGFGVDEVNNYDGLKLAEIEEALAGAYEETGAEFELIGFDACLMATLETASVVAPYGKYFVASEELEPGHGWYYTPILEAIKQNPNITGDDLGRVIADGFALQAQEWGTGQDITLSVTDLSKIGNVKAALEELVAEASPNVGDLQTFNLISSGASKAESYGGNTAQEGFTDLIDLADFAKYLKGGYPEADKLIAAVNDAVVYKINGPTKSYSNGLSIYLPYRDKANFANNLAIYDSIDFSPVYESFVRSFTARINGDNRSVALKEDTSQTEEGSFQIVIDEEDRENIAHIYFVLGKYLEGYDDDVILDLGMDSDLEYNPETGIATDNFYGWWVALNGNLVSLDIYREKEDYNLYSIPALLNGEEVSIKAAWIWDEDFESGGYYEVYGAWKGIDEETGMADRNLIEIKPGNRITPIFRCYNLSTDETQYIEGEEFVLEEEIQLHDFELPLGDYLYGFYLVDYAQNGSYADFAVIELAE
ncbi:MAG: peptidase C11 clostripain [Firmicutes bacterium]|nr:peptidase C11 clostripain [Bacillota bacterium]